VKQKKVMEHQIACLKRPKHLLTESTSNLKTDKMVKGNTVKLSHKFYDDAHEISMCVPGKTNSASV
jgi:hypothetical protein